MPIYRIRRYSGHRGGSNSYHHADVVATHWTKALKAAKEGRVKNWRWVDTFDKSDENYTSFEFLYRVQPEAAKKPAHPGSLFTKKNTALRHKIRCIGCGRSGKDACVKPTKTGEFCRYCRAGARRTLHGAVFCS